MAKLRLEIVTPEGRAYQDDVDMVVLPGADGELGVYSGHTQLMTQLAPGEVRILKDGNQTELVVGSGFAEITQTQVSVITDSALEDELIDEKVTEEAIHRAEAALQDKSLASDEAAEAEAALARSLAQLRFKRRRRH
jgi:F-type H+-transporting ATPase subunit epsilon